MNTYRCTFKSLIPSSHSRFFASSFDTRSSIAALSFSSVFCARKSDRWKNESPVLYLCEEKEKRERAVFISILAAAGSCDGIAGREPR